MGEEVKKIEDQIRDLMQKKIKLEEEQMQYEAEVPQPDKEEIGQEKENTVLSACKMLQGKVGSWVTLLNDGNEIKTMPGVPIKIAAMEVYKWLNVGKWGALLGVAGNLLVVIGSFFFGLFGACLSALFVIVVLAYMLIKMVKEMKRLEAKYDLIVKKVKQ